MPIRLSSYLWLRNSDLIPIIEDPYHQPHMKPEEKARLRKIVDEIDELRNGSDVGQNTGGLIGPGVVLSGYTEIIERTYDPDRTRDLFHQIHDVLKEYFVPVGIYRNLGRAFAELNITNIDPELKLAIDYGTKNFDMSRDIYGPEVHDRMCARVVIDREKRSKGSPERS